MLAAARIPDRRDMVDVDPEAEAPTRSFKIQFARLPGFTALVFVSSGGSSSSA